MGRRPCQLCFFAVFEMGVVEPVVRIPLDHPTTLTRFLRRVEEIFRSIRERFDQAFERDLLSVKDGR